MFGAYPIFKFLTYEISNYYYIFSWYFDAGSSLLNYSIACYNPVLSYTHFFCAPLCAEAKTSVTILIK
jgi:hypothetical protein